MPTLVQAKVRQACEILREFDVDCWVTFVRESEICGDPTLDLILGSAVTWHSAFILTQAGRSVAIVGNYDADTVKDTGAYGEVIPYVTAFSEPFQRVLTEIAPRTIAVNYSMDSEVCDGLTHGMFLTISDLLRAIGMAERIVSSEPIVSALRQRKTGHELGLMRCAIRETEEIFHRLEQAIRPGRTEEDIAQHIRMEAHTRGLGCAWNPQSCPAVFTGPATEGGHYGPSSRCVEAGHLLHIDFGVRVEGYCSDIQRTFYVRRPGEPAPPPEVIRGFTTVVEAIEMARQAIRPGVTGECVDAVARRHITRSGYAEFASALGHQVGRFAHDGTALLGPPWEKYGQKPFFPLEEGMVFTLEPRVMVPGHGVVSLEEMVVVTRTGADFLTTPETALICVGP